MTGTKEFLRTIAKNDVTGLIFTDLSTDNLKFVSIGVQSGNGYYLRVVYDMRLEVVKNGPRGNSIQTYTVSDPLILEVLKKEAVGMSIIRKEVLKHLLKVSTLIENKVVYKKLETIKRMRRRGLI